MMLFCGVIVHILYVICIAIVVCINFTSIISLSFILPKEVSIRLRKLAIFNIKVD